MTPYIDIDIVDVNYFYSDYELTDDQLDNYDELIDDGLYQNAIDTFVLEKIEDPCSKYQDTLSTYLGISSLGLIEEKKKNKLLRVIALLSLGYAALATSNYSKFIRSKYSKYIFNQSGLTNKDIQKAVLSDIIESYKQTIKNVTPQVQSFVSNGIKTLQKELLVKGVILDSGKVTNKEINYGLQQFRNELKNKYPSLFKAIETGNLYKSKKIIDGDMKIRHQDVTKYFKEISKSSLLDLDRTSTLIAAQLNGEPVVEYTLIHSRPVKKERELCQVVLSNKTFGQSLLALDENVADILGIMTVEEATNTPDYCMGYGCRHGLRRLGGEELIEIENFIKQNK